MTTTDNVTASVAAAHAALDAREGWRTFGSSVFYTSPVERFTVILSPVPVTENNIGYVEVSMYDAEADVPGLDGGPVVSVKIAATPTGNLVAAAVAALAAHLERKVAS